MEAAIEKVMQAYGLMVTLTAEEQRKTRERLEEFLLGKEGDDHSLAVQGLQFLRGGRQTRRRNVSPPRSESCPPRAP